MYSICAELVAPGEVELFHRSHERDVSVGDQIREVMVVAAKLLDQGNDQPEVGGDDLVSDLLALAADDDCDNGQSNRTNQKTQGVALFCAEARRPCLW